MKDKPEQTSPPPPLEYRSPSQGALMPYVAQMSIGFATYLAALVLLVLIANYDRGSVIPGLIGVIALLVGSVLFTYISWGWTGFAAGILLGVGITCLAFAALVAFFAYIMGGAGH